MRRGPRSAPIMTPRSPHFSNIFNRWLQIEVGSRFGADSHTMVALASAPRPSASHKLRYQTFRARELSTAFPFSHLHSCCWEVRFRLNFSHADCPGRLLEAAVPFPLLDTVRVDQIQGEQRAHPPLGEGNPNATHELVDLGIDLRRRGNEPGKLHLRRFRLGLGRLANCSC